MRRAGGASGGPASRSSCCPRCGAAVQAPDLMHSEWRCAGCGPVEPLSVLSTVGPAVLASVHERLSDADERTPLWCPWPLPTGWTVTGVGWAGDDRALPRATALAVSGPSPFSSGPADIVFVAEQPGIGLGAGLGGLRTADAIALDAGPALGETVAHSAAQAKVRADGHPTPLWAVDCGPDRSVHVGEARAMWLYVIAWPESAAYLLMDGIRLHDLGESLPAELVYGADSGRLHPRPGGPSGPRDQLSGRH